jgi:hypothetical protein
MRIATMALATMAAGCSLYEGGDAGDVVDAGSAVDASAMAGTYAVRWECLANPCLSPIAASPGAAVQALVSSGNPAAIEWVKNGDPGPAFTHTGRVVADCILVGAGRDELFQRDAYELCGGGGDMTWTSPTGERSSWRVSLERL